MTTQNEYDSVAAALYLEERDTIPQAELAEIVDYSQPYVSQALGDLEEAGAIRKERAGRGNIIYVEDYELLVEREPKLEEIDLEGSEEQELTSSHTSPNPETTGTNRVQNESIEEIMDQEITVGEQDESGVEEATELDNQVTRLGSESGLETEQENKRFDVRT